VCVLLVLLLFCDWCKLLVVKCIVTTQLDFESLKVKHKYTHK